jgi:hypothetical protein
MKEADDIAMNKKPYKVIKNIPEENVVIMEDRGDSDSPEMKALKERVKELDNSLSIALEVNESHQRYNGKLQTRLTELEEDNKKLSHQIEDKIGQLREKGLM